MGKRLFPLKIDPLLKDIAEVFLRGGKQVYLVGGAVRDLLRGKPAQDWDLATDARPEEVAALFRRVIPTGIRHGTVTVRFRGRSVEVSTFRTESGYSDGRRPDRVSYAAAIEEDLSRRDFTMNALALALPGGALVDPFGGEEDIRRGLIRAVGNPGERFAEDGLRPLRALRFAAQLGFEPDPATLEAIPPALPVCAKVSPERVREELDKIILSPRPVPALRLMESSGLLGLFIPELAACRGIEQKGYHRFDVLDHSLLACGFAAREDRSLEVRLAALFHDLGKRETRRLDEGGSWTFYRHEEASARLAGEILRRLRYPNTVIQRVSRLAGDHMFHYDESWGDAAVRRFVIRVGEENLEDLFALRRADAFALGAVPPPPEFLLPFRERIAAVLAAGRALSLRDLAVSGDDLIRQGIPPGKTLGIILRELLDTVIADPGCNTRETLLEIASNLPRPGGGFIREAPAPNKARLPPRGG
jgi:putative nucleotidyltransferase with HDIG domain